MTDELFTIQESKSPKLAWMEKHEIRIKRNWEDYEAEEIYPYVAYNFDLPSVYEGGKTEMEAISSLAVKLGIKLWDEV